MRATAEAAAGDLEYYRLNANAQWFYPLTSTFTFGLSGDVGFVHGLGGKQVPFFKNFYAGGPGSIRGYRAFSVGPQDAQGNVLGGTRKITGSAEIYFPIPGAQQDKSLRLSVFLDAGQAFGPDEKIDLGNLRYSAGVGLAWNSPFGPLRLSFGQPLNAKSGLDRIERLQFNIGTTF
jgi:outer membrane protein insertion porin family